MRAVKRLAEEGSPRAFESLAGAIHDEDVRVSCAAVTALGNSDSEKATAVLIQALSDQRPEVRQTAVEALKARLEPPVIIALAGRLSDFDAGVRSRAARALESARWHPANTREEIWFNVAKGQFAQINAFGAQAIEALELVLLGDHYSLQAGALKALGQIADERVLKPLVRALKSNDHAVRVAAIAALAHFGGAKAAEALVPMLRHPDHRVRVTAIDAVADLEGQPAVKALRTLLRDSIWDVRRAAARALGKCRDTESVDSLVGVLKDPDNDVRESAITALGEIGDGRAVGPIVLALVDADSSVRRTAGITIQKLDLGWAASQEAQQVFPELRAAFDSSDVAVRYAAMRVLGLMGKLPGQAPGLKVSSAAVTAAGQKQRKILALFVELLQDQDRDVRLASVQTLGRLADPQAASPLMTAMSDADESVRHAATEAVESLNFLEAG